jgi:MATE family multidrug resistance protein
VALACNLFNVVANAALIFGVGPIPALGAAGSAIATALSMFALSAGLLLATRPTLAAWWPQGPGVLAPRAIGRLLLDALPVGLQTALEVWAFNAAGVMMGWFGDSVVAAHTVALQLASLTFTVPFGISAAAATRVGNLFGAGLAWGRSALVAVGLGAAVMSVGAVLFASLPGPLAAAFNRDPEVLEVAVRLLPIAAAFALFDGTQVVAFGALRGVGDIRVPTLANVLGFWLLGLPVGYVLAFPYAWGPVGVWAGLTLGLVSVASLLLLRLAWLVRRAGGLDAAPQTAPGRAS